MFALYIELLDAKQFIVVGKRGRVVLSESANERVKGKQVNDV
jgi:hypothetical protein